MYMPPDTRLRLDPRDEYTHTPEAAGNYNESMYFNAFDTATGVGAWFRLGNRPNEGHAEMTCCIYLPGGRVAFMFGRPAIDNNDAMDAGGMRFEVIEPFRRLRCSYEGELLIMDDPLAMANPSRAFKTCPKKPGAFVLDFEGISPMHGGEIVTMDGRPIDVDPALSVYRGHTEQNMAVTGHITVDGQRFDFVQGTGYRDKSWGPRHWHSFFWYKWIPVTFDRDFGVLLSIKGRPEGGANRISGNVLRGGVYEPVIDGRIETDYDKDWYPRAVTATVTTVQGVYLLQGRVLCTVPLRHRRRDGGSDTRITESLTEWRCGDRIALGMTEFCDRMDGGVPVSEAGRATPAAAMPEAGR
ncbi:hypothetical protein DFR41_105321 [Pseudacidovorax intermedius]|uniref:DUF7064 domain-containing protein n=1 Tax=Pseudacidovorax intermedius TaxID=433924 RepID=A0A370FEE4_9BURK|nr:hypothetical protein [Pseudacidovorax intermedius]RDI24406.1 hypothetical protein DFR41_105321 [Pseudacidovorax intermedius]